MSTKTKCLKIILNLQFPPPAKVHRVDFREIVGRDGGRQDVRFNVHLFPFAAPGLIYNSVVFPLVQNLLGGGDVSLLYCGVMWASRGSDPQEVSDAKNVKLDGANGSAEVGSRCI